MTNQGTVALDAVFVALGDPKRRKILELLVGGELTVGEVAKPLGIPLPTASKHVRVLEDARLISRRVEGRRHWLSLDPVGFRTVVNYVTGYERFWEMSFERLDRLVRRIEAGEGGP